MNIDWSTVFFGLGSVICAWGIVMMIGSATQGLAKWIRNMNAPYKPETHDYYWAKLATAERRIEALAKHLDVTFDEGMKVVKKTAPLLLALLALSLAGCQSQSYNKVTISSIPDGAPVRVSVSDALYRSDGIASFQRYYKQGSSDVFLTAEDFSGWQFKGWSNDGQLGPAPLGANPERISFNPTATADYDVTANYGPIQPPSPTNAVPPVVTNTPPVAPPVVPPAQVFQYIGNDLRDKAPAGGDQWTAFNGMSVRLAVNSVGDLAKAGIGCVKGSWYALDGTVVPKGSITLATAPDGGIIVTCQDFVSSRSGTKYHCVGFYVQFTRDASCFRAGQTTQIPKAQCNETLRIMLATVQQ